MCYIFTSTILRRLVLIYTIETTKTKINIDSIKNLFANDIGAIVSFFGIIRDTNNFKKVKSIDYLIFEELFISILEKKCIHLLNDNKKVKIYIIQYQGSLQVTEINSIISVASDNRKTAFYICRELVETLKYNTPIWKKEHYLDGSFKWLNV